MRHTNDHIGDEELLLTLDGESSAQRARQVRAHVANCPTCRARMEAIEGAAADFNRAYRAAENPPAVPLASSRASLQRRLTPMSTASAPSSWLQRWVNPFSTRGWAYVCAAALLVCALGLGWLHRQGEQHEANLISVPYGSGPVLPDEHLTPGATRPVTANQICSAGGPSEMRPPLPVQRAVFHEYGMDGAPARNYEVDHLITPALGGTDDIRNLWPEPYTSTQWNAHVKDELEDHLHNLVCGGKLDLATAQRDMASNWIRAYKKYFHSDQPLPRTSDLIENRRRTRKG
jgi:hypothetical protein